MNAPFEAGAIGVEARVADGRIVATRISSTRPTQLSRALVGRPVDDAPALVGRLFALCGVAHATACAHAVAAARRASLEAGSRPAESAAALAERLAETMRGTMLAPGAPPLDPQDAGALRDVLAAARALVSRAGGGVAREAAQRLGVALGRLGLPAAAGGPPEGRLARLLAEACAETAFPAEMPDALTPADDSAVVSALLTTGETFAAAPALPGRTVETGAYARHAGVAAIGESALAARLSARVADMGDCRDALLAAVDGRAQGLVQSAVTGANEGYAALESPRGRLYHWLRATADGKIAAYAIVAPTEWNFHAQGPFAKALTGARVGEGETARRRVERLAALFDPCVACSVSVAEAGAG